MEITFNIRCDTCQEWSSAQTEALHTTLASPYWVCCPHCGATYSVTMWVSREYLQEED